MGASRNKWASIFFAPNYFVIIAIDVFIIDYYKKTPLFLVDSGFGVKLSNIRGFFTYFDHQTNLVSCLIA